MFETWYTDGGFNVEGVGHVWDLEFMNVRLSEEQEDAVRSKGRDLRVRATEPDPNQPTLREAIDDH